MEHAMGGSGSRADSSAAGGGVDAEPTVDRSDDEQAVDGFARAAETMKTMPSLGCTRHLTACVACNPE
jgi:hypothetical protein